MTATASLAAHRGYSGLTSYAASKGGIVALVRSLAAELGERIRVNVVSGGGGTDSRIAGRNAEALGVPPPPNRGRRVSPVRANDPREVAQAHLFLVSPEASYITGQVIITDLGATSMAPEELGRLFADRFDQEGG
jgi:NAD(P)-dependent dehydrogenase (short-subunit alcohol dehydrogenase family)